MKRLLALLFTCVVFIVKAQYLIPDTNSLYVIDFNNYAGTGLSPNPLAEQLNSNQWSITGMSDGNVLFADSNTTGDFARGISNGKVTVGGLYAFNVNDGQTQRILGVQPIGTDFTPGDIILRMKNIMNDTIRSMYIEYDIYYLNNEGRSSSLKFSYSEDSINYTFINALDFETKDTAETTPKWTMLKRIAKIDSLKITTGKSFFLKWKGDDVGGAGSRDEYGIGNIRFVANPLSLKANFVFNDSTIYCDTAQICFSDMSYATPADSILSRLWDFNDGSQSADTNPCHTFTNTTDSVITYKVALVTSTLNGKSDTIIQNVIVHPNPKVAYSYSNGTGTTLLFTDQSVVVGDSIKAWQWSFGDGDSSALQSPSHLYAQTGIFFVCLTTTTDKGCTNKDCDSIILLTTHYPTESSSDNVKLYPSISESGMFTLIVANAKLENELKVYDMLGQVVFCSKIKDSTALINLSELPSGNYLFKISGKTETIKRVVLIK